MPASVVSERATEHVHLAVQGAVLQRYEYNREEINGIALSASRQFLAAADDAGEVAVIDVRVGALYKRLRGGHANIASGAPQLGTCVA